MIDKVNDFRTYVISLTIVLVSAIIGTTIYYVNDRILMAKNIENAISKNMDPLAVRCAYVTNTDTICVAHAASIGKK